MKLKDYYTYKNKDSFVKYVLSYCPDYRTSMMSSNGSVILAITKIETKLYVKMDEIKHYEQLYEDVIQELMPQLRNYLLDGFNFNFPEVQAVL